MADRDGLIQMLREEVELVYTARYSEHRDLDAETTADNILASDWLAEYRRQVIEECIEHIRAHGFGDMTKDEALRMLRSLKGANRG